METEKLIELATKAILERLNAGGQPSTKPDTAKVAAFGEIPEGLIPGAVLKPGKTVADVEGCDYIVMSAAAFYALHGGAPVTASPTAAASPDSKLCIDLTGKRLIHERDLRDAGTARDSVVRIAKNAIITALAYDYAKSVGAKFVKE